MFQFSKISYFQRINCHDAFIIMAVSLPLLLKHLFAYPTFNFTTIIILSVIVFLSLIIIILDFFEFENNKDSIACLSVMFAGMLIGITQFDLIFTFVLLIAIFIRIFISTVYLRFILPLLAIIMVVLGYLFNMFNNLIDYLTPIFTRELFFNYVFVLTIFGLLLLLGFWNLRNTLALSLESVEDANNRSREQLRNINTLARFIPNQIWQPIIQENLPASVFNKRTKLTIFFSDIVNFTELSDNISADKLAEILNTYMNRMTMIAKNHGAVLDKFIGDGMMCFFGADGKGTVKDNALKCVAMALDMRREMRLLHLEWQKEGFAEGLAIRMGINTGFCHVGNFGTELRMSYTAIGKEVNMASRLESVAQPNEILISQSTYEYISYEYNCAMVQSIPLKGFGVIPICWKVLEPISSKMRNAQWVDYNLSGFNLHLNFKDVKDYDYSHIKEVLDYTLEQVEYHREKNNKALLKHTKN
ncbi:MAG: adenylate/guanylate cyclase domain-containing protein [Moraxellaceae bacterium]|nr:adenylate/guanylate cyclase domain-containing protein [Moraxellaceae bacterium]